MLAESAAIAIIILGYFFYFHKLLWFYLKHPKIWGVPGIGLIYKFFGVDSEDLYTIAVGLSNNIKRSHSWWLGPMLWITLKKPEEIKIILNSEESFDKPDHGTTVYFKNGLLNDGGAKYKLHRKAITPFFLPSNLRSFFPIINQKMTNFLARFEAKYGETSKQFNITDDVMDFTLDTIFKTMFNVDHVDEKKRKNYLENMDHYLSLCSIRIYKFWLSNDFIFKRSQIYPQWKKYRESVMKFTADLVEKNENDFKIGHTNEKKVTIPDYFYKVRGTMELDEALENILLLLVGSYETTGSVLPNILLAFAMNPQIQENIYQEVSGILSSPDDEVTEDQWNQMEYLERCIKEGMRFFPASVFLARKIKKDLKMVDFILPSSANVLIFTHNFHLNREFWGDDVMEFNPDRFLEENIKKVHPYAYFPFSNGPRICSGYKYAWIVMKIFLSRFLMKYKVHTTLKYEDLKYTMRLTTSIAPGAMISIEKREGC